ncbi:hypothetical protein BGY98DRAFT_1116514 [Russula aff. rugulosa BPL654]|nr:hypothetical protein BGY98DRAFT_1116514 [Russula aff. rugulosa BPL654]
MSYTINVSGIPPSTTEQQLRNYFVFCGSISNIDFDEDKTASDPSTEPKTAVIHYEKPSAVKTALMLNGSLFEGGILNVHSDAVHPDEEDEEATHVPGAPLDQSDKPRAGIAAEYLAKGYKLSDGILQRAIHIDSEKGISKRFLNYFQSIDSSIGAKALGPEQTISGKVTSTFQTATQHARTVDEQRGYSKVAGDYYTRALGSNLGQRVRAFYTTTSKQILDIHEEARRIADEHKASQGAPEYAQEEPRCSQWLEQGGLEIGLNDRSYFLPR